MPPAAAAIPSRSARRPTHQILVGDELVAVALKDAAGELPSADHEDLLVVLLELFNQADEIAVAADNDERVDVRVRERHLQSVERKVDVRAVLVAARRQVALHHLDRVLRQHAAVATGPLPVAIGRLGDDVAALFEGFEDDARVERRVQGLFDANFDVVEVDEDGEPETLVRVHKTVYR